jgi:glycosyltransferase involved in cell wall biosynthesis
MSAARPIVATRSGGMEEMLAGGEAGLLVGPGDVRGLEEALCRLIEDPGLAGRLAREARRRLLAEYDPAVIAPRYEALYAEAIARRRSYVCR